MTESAIAALIVLGALFVLLGSIGLARLPDFLTRLHGPTKATTLGVGALLLASAIFFSTREGGAISLHELAILFFLFITAPVTAHLLAKAALHRQAKGPGDDPQATVTGDSLREPEQRSQAAGRKP
ncbi:MAG: Na+/H+ antiporter subunit G [Candidatus Accumulibacter sp.]|uniref:Na+/H+ antiporter subunit G n=1 Tax=Candidatus Accumulibacter TaxID=327159 RepID=UPI0020868BDF|nr:Na+/H+ antiporter subunit G [Accumulibacter sp.]MBK8113722.1 Na+/H+ antiporter subunit G [Accumulibacter sp.]MBK8386612.1 Na+/H+ antiporter subunit G [Accumulibacter sp.]MBK8578774.1 Na+/H+ antiporter subunit G [Candidatus Accumulibacter propinquus]